MTRRRPARPDEPDELRRRAESRLSDGKETANPRRSNAGSEHLLHELEVHQIELEMQNAELVEARDAVEGALETYTDLYDFAPVGYFSIDETGRILDANLAGAALLGVERSRLVERKLQRFVAPQSQPVFEAFLRIVFERPERQICEVPLTSADGTTIWADFQAASASSLRDGRRWCRVAVSDVSELKRAEEAQLRADALAARNKELDLEIERRREVETSLKRSKRHYARLLAESNRMQGQLRQLSRGIFHAQEEERRRISRELHDEVAQSAIGINLHLQMLGREASGRSKEYKSRIDETRRMLTELLEAVHRCSRDLRPTVLDDLGLIPALRSFTAEFSSRTGIEVVFTPAAAAERMENAERIVIYRVAQEALNNVARHANATRVELRLEEAPGVIRMDVADDGKSFDVKRILAAKKQGRLGLIGMRERVEMVGGAFSIDSSPGKGTRVRVEIPLAGAKRVRRRRTPGR